MAKKSIKAKKPKDKTAFGALSQSRLTFSPEEIQILEELAKQIAASLQGHVMSVTGPSTITQCKPEASNPSQMTYRRLAMVGGETMACTGAYFGNRDGLILKFRPITVPLGLKAVDMEGLMYEVPLKASGSLLDSDGNSLSALVKQIIPANETLDGIVAKVREAEEERERQRLIKEAQAKTENYGVNWGAF